MSNRSTRDPRVMFAGMVACGALVATLAGCAAPGGVQVWDPAKGSLADATQTRAIEGKQDEPQKHYYAYALVNGGDVTDEVLARWYADCFVP